MKVEPLAMLIGLAYLTHALATSALDAESETLVNAALASLLRSNNTTISIAHRLSTIKRSDLIIVLSPDGTVAEQGTYKQLSSDPNGAFTKLMEYQMSGGETAASQPRGPPTEAYEEDSSMHVTEDVDGPGEHLEDVKVGSNEAEKGLRP